MKRAVLVILALAILLGAAQAAKRDTTAADGYKIHAVTDRPEALYKIGEKVTFRVTLSKDDKPLNAEVAYTISDDGVYQQDSGTLALENGAAEVSATRGKPGFAQCRATFKTPTGKTIYAIAAGGYEPEKIEASMPPPDDFGAFWDDQLAQLAKVPMNPRLEPVESNRDDVEAFDVTLDCLGGAPVRGYYARPKGARPGSLPAILNLHGAGVRSSSLWGPVNHASKGRLAMDINAHGIENGRPKEFYDALAKGELADYRARGMDDRETIYFRGMYLRLARAMDFLMAQPEWDGQVLIATGSSQGGGQSLAAAGLNPKVTAFMANVPALCEHTGPINGWPRFLRPERDTKPDPKVAQAVRYVDAMNFAARTKARAVLTVGFIDQTCRPTSVYAAYNNLRGPKRMETYPLMGHAVPKDYGQLIEEIVEGEIARARGR